MYHSGVFLVHWFQYILNFSSWEHCNCVNGRTAGKTLDDPLGNTARTFFGNIVVT